MRSLTVVWLIFTLLFLILGLLHLVESRKNIASFQVTKIEHKQVDSEFVTSLTDVDIEKPLRDFAQDFNTYLEDYNKSSKNQNLFAAFGYFLACATAFISMCLTWR